MNFWEEKSLSEMTDSEWESLCDGCARCCLIKLEDEDTGQIVTSDVHCSLMNEDTCGCTDYENRQTRVPDCIKLTPINVPEINWMPVTCAYRRLSEGKGLAWWHPLVSGDKQTVVDAGISVKGRSISEAKVQEEDWEEHIVGWPDFDPTEDPK